MSKSKIKRTQKSYTADFKEEAVKLITEQSYTLSDAADRLGVSKSALSKMFDCVFKTREEAKSAVFEYIEIFYNRERRHSTLRYCSPVEFEQYFELENVV